MEQQAKILIVEDEDSIRENLEELLIAKGYHVRTAANGKQGVLEAIDFCPNVIVCDIMMPKMDGFKVLEYVRKTAAIQNTPFIFLTAKIDKQDVRSGMELGADDYITKPFAAKELITSIETRLKKHDRIVGEYAKVKHELDTTVFATYYHEFNTPLHGIIGGLNLLINARDSFSDKQIHELLLSILKSGLRLNHSLANLMLFEEIKRAEVHRELITMFTTGRTSGQWPQRLHTELQTMAREIYNRADDLKFDMEAADININPEYLLRIVLEITDNALKFSKSGQQVSVRGRKVDDTYLIEVKDNGRGFILESLDQIAPFKQFNRAKFEQQGLGIGLYLVKRLAEFNQGELKISSIEGEGTTVNIVLASYDL